MTSGFWNYDSLAASYDNRPDYAPEALARILQLAAVSPGDVCVDMGAGTGRLTLHLLKAGLAVHAVEPSASMREIGIQSTSAYPSIQWIAATAEDSGLPAGGFALVTFGSSFNVTDRPKALRETSRLLRENGWFACLWNHRDLDDPLQAEIEAFIRTNVEGYAYGSRREDQSAVIEASGLFETPVCFEARVTHAVSATAWTDAWRSHATLARQAGDRLPQIVDAIGGIVKKRSPETISVPYVTRVWAARVRT